MICQKQLDHDFQAFLISSLSSTVPSVPFKDMKSLLSSKYQISTIKESQHQAQFEFAKSGTTYHDAWNSKFKVEENSLLRNDCYRYQNIYH